MNDLMPKPIPAMPASPINADLRLNMDFDNHVEALWTA